MRDVLRSGIVPFRFVRQPAGRMAAAVLAGALSLASQAADTASDRAWGGCPTGEAAAGRADTEAPAATLKQVTARALSRNPELGRALAQLRKADADVETADSAYAPQLRLNALAGGANDGSGGGLARAANAQLSKLLHDFGKTDSLVAEARERRDARAEEHAETVARIQFDIVEAWLAAARQSEFARLNRQHSQGLEDAARVLRLRAQAGLIGAGEVELARARLAQTQAAAITACVMRDQAVSRLAALSGGSVAATRFEVPASLQRVPGDAWDAALLPAVRQAEAELRALQHRVQSIQASQRPSVVLQAGYAPRGANGPSGPTTAQRFVNVALNMDISGAGLESRIEAASAEAEAARMRIRAAREAAEDSLRRARAELAGIDVRQPLLASVVASAALTRRNFMEQFLAGRRQVLDLLNTHQELLAAEIALAGLAYDRMLAVARLHALHGELSRVAAATAAQDSTAPDAAPDPAPLP